MAWDYSGSVSLDMVRSDSGLEAGLIRMSSYPTPRCPASDTAPRRTGLESGWETRLLESTDGTEGWLRCSGEA